MLPEDFKPVTRQPDGTAAPIRSPGGIQGSGNADGHMVVFQPDGKAFESYATIVLSDGTVVCLTYQVTDPMLAGEGWQNGVTASMIPVYAGLLRQSELDAGVIDHAIKIVTPAGLMMTAAVYPALAFDRGALTEQPAYSGTVPMGGLLALPPGVAIAAMGLRTKYGKAIAAAALGHGFIVTDRGGGGITLVTEAGANPDWNGDVEADLRKVMAAVKLVSVPSGTYPGDR